MLISIRASSCPWCQRDQLVKGFEELGHDVTDDWRDPAVSFVFVGNGPYDEYLEAARYRSKRIIFNILDIATQNSNAAQYVAEYKANLPLAAHITSISAFTQWQLREYCGLDSTVIYYPMKPVFDTEVKRYPYRALACGRVGDRNKRFDVAVAALQRAGYSEADLAVVGPERPHWGTYLGVIDDTTLNDLYHSVDYVMMMSRLEGAGLPAIESACAGSIPIVAPDLTTYNELWAVSPMGLYYQTFRSIDQIASTIRYLDGAPADKAIMKGEMKRYADLFLRPKFDRVEVARRILAVAQAL
jgi:glycosyltransferase involved in cell wall biosynthesis